MFSRLLGWNTESLKLIIFAVQASLFSIFVSHPWVAMVADVRRTYVDGAIRMMKYILSNKLVMDYNMSGHHR